MIFTSIPILLRYYCATKTQVRRPNVPLDCLPQYSRWSIRTACDLRGTGNTTLCR